MRKITKNGRERIMEVDRQSQKEQQVRRKSTMTGRKKKVQKGRRSNKEEGIKKRRRNNKVNGIKNNREMTNKSRTGIAR